MLQFACSLTYIPLTLTLREREQLASDWCLADGCWANSGTGVTERRWTILPLPWGEGQGEGKRRECPTRVLDIPETGELGESSGGAGLFPN